MFSPVADDVFATRWVAAMQQLGGDPTIALNVVIDNSGDEGLPRASSIGGCAARTLYRITNTPKSDTPPVEHSWSAWMGYAGQELKAEILRRMGYLVTTAHPTLRSAVMTGHIDGLIKGLDLGDELVLWDSKIRNLFGYRKLVREGLPKGDPEMYLQMQWYMGQLGLKWALVTIAPHDYSSMRNENTRYKVGIHNVIIQRIVLPFEQRAYELAEERARTINAAKELGLQVAREFNPTNPNDFRFPCSFCPWLTKCMADDFERSVEGVLEVPPIPDEWKEAT